MDRSPGRVLPYTLFPQPSSQGHEHTGRVQVDPSAESRALLKALGSLGVTHCLHHRSWAWAAPKLEEDPLFPEVESILQHPLWTGFHVVQGRGSWADVASSWHQGVRLSSKAQLWGGTAWREQAGQSG